MRTRFILTVALTFFLTGNVVAQDTTLVVPSPSGVLDVHVVLRDGTPTYEVRRMQRPVVAPSRLGMVLRDGRMDAQLRLVSAQRRSFDETWEQPWGEVRFIRNHYNELTLRLEHTPEQAASRHFDLVFRVYDDGIGFRYVWPEQAALSAFEVMDESTEFRFAGDPTTWSIGAYQDNRYEYLYEEMPLSHVRVAHTPFTLRTEDNLYVSIHEAALVDFPSMTLNRLGTGILKADLVPWASGVRAYGEAPYASSWRTIQISDTPGGLITSYLVLNLNEPSRLTDVSWIEPGKYVGVWWGMHIGVHDWNYTALHGARTDTVKKYIDFAARNGFSGVLVEGWNVGWDQAWWDGQGHRFRFYEPHPNFDVQILAQYARERGVRLIGHHETGAIVDNYEAQMDSAFAFAAHFGMNAVKTGYVGSRLRTTDGQVEWHHGQFGVRHYQRSVESAAQHRIMLNIHEPIKDTGLRRTWPNLLTREGARGMEYDAWSGDGGNPPSHHVLLPFTRSLGGPFDYTPGVVDLFYPETRPNNRVNMTLAKGLALYVTIYSPLHMVADLPENLENHPAMEWLRAVPTDWEDTQVLNASVGQYVTIVRKDRNSRDWYLGSITNDTGRQLDAPLTFLEPGVTYEAHIFADGPNGDWRTVEGSLELVRDTKVVRRGDVLPLRLAPGGGQAIRFTPIP